VRCFNWLDALAGHDPLDSTTVTDEYKPVDLEGVDPVAKLRGLSVGIPRVTMCCI
jgi:hypothetical protein